MSGYRVCACGEAFYPNRASQRSCWRCGAGRGATATATLVGSFESACRSLPSAQVTTGDDRAQERVEFSDALGPEFEREFWKSLERETATSREAKRLEQDDVPERRPKVGRRWFEQSSGIASGPRPTSYKRPLLQDNRGDDPLRDVSPFDYVPLLTGITVPPSGMIACPFHPDRTPSLHVWPEGWYCHGCHLGGDIYSMAAALWKMELRGEGFKALRRELARLILREAA